MRKFFSLYNKRTRWFILFLLCSILLHIIIGFFFLDYGFQKKALKIWHSFTQDLTKEQRKQLQIQRTERQEKIVNSLQKLMGKPQDNRPAKLVAKKSPFGWVLFDQPPQQQAQLTSIPTTIDGPVAEAKTSNATEEEPVEAEGKQAPTQEPEIKPETPSVQDVTPEKPVQETQPEAPAFPTQEKLPFPEIADKEARIERIKAIESKLASVSPHDLKQAPTGSPESSAVAQGYGGTGKVTTQQVRGAYSEQEKPKRNIITLTKGFIEKLDGEDGNDLIDRDGDPDKRPTFEELKYISYESKLTWSLQASWKQNFERHQTHNQCPEGECFIEFTIDQHGKLANCTMLQSTGNSQLDAMIMKNMKFASPFPPIPKHFNCSTYTTGRRIHVYAHKYNF